MTKRVPLQFEAKVVGRVQIDPDKYLHVDHQTLQGVDFGGRKLESFSAAGSRFQKCRFDKLKITNGQFSAGSGKEMCTFMDCSFDGARIRFGSGGYARFEHCSFRNVDLRDWFCFTIEIVDCTFSGRLRHSWFNGTVPEEKRAMIGRERNEFRGNDFSDMELLDVGFRTGIDLSQQRLPSGPDYLYLPDAAEVVRRARAEVIEWTDLELRRRALTFLKTLGDDVDKGQCQMLLRAKDYGKPIKAHIEAVFALLRKHNGRLPDSRE